MSTAVTEVRGTLDKLAPEIARVLPPHVTPEKFIRVAQTAINMNPKLAECDRTSLLGSIMKCAQDGLLPDGREAAIVHYKTKEGPVAQYLPMIAGILKKVRQSGEIETITAQVVYEKDTFDYELGDAERIVHKPYLEGDRGKPRLAYAIAKTKDGGVYREVMTATEVGAVRNASRAKDSGPWAGPFATEMWRKTVLRRLSKRLPMSTDLEQVIQRDDELYDFGGRAIGAGASPAIAALPNPAGETSVPAGRSRKLAARVAGATIAEPEPAPVAAPAPAPEPEVVPTDGIEVHEEQSAGIADEGDI